MRDTRRQPSGRANCLCKKILPPPSPPPSTSLAGLPAARQAWGPIKGGKASA